MVKKNNKLLSKKEIIKEAKLILKGKSKAKSLGSGEFSEIYDFHGSIIKINRLESLHDPGYYHFNKIEFNKISKEELIGETETYNLLKPEFGKILPSFFIGYDFKFNKIDRFLIYREKLDIKNLKDYKDKIYEFIDTYFKIFKYGTFIDDIQVGIRKNENNEEIILYDLGHFFKREWFKNELKKSMHSEITEFMIDEEIYSWSRFKIDNLCKKFGIDYYIEKNFAKMLYENQLGKYRKEYEENLKYYDGNVEKAKKETDSLFGEKLEKFKKLSE